MYPVLWVVLSVAATLVPIWLFGLVAEYAAGECFLLSGWIIVSAAAWVLFQSSVFVHTFLCRLSIKSEFWPIVPITVATAVWSVSGLALYFVTRFAGMSCSESVGNSVLAVSLVCSALFLMELIAPKDEFPVLEPCDMPIVDLDDEPPNWPSRVPIPYAIGMILAGSLVYAIPIAQVALAVYYWNTPSMLPLWLLGSSVAWAVLLAFSQLNIRLALPLNSDWALTASVARLGTRGALSFLLAWAVYGLIASFTANALVPTGLLVAVRVFACLPFLVGATAFWAVKGQRRIVKELTWG